MAETPTQRTIRELRKMGRRCAIVEKWNSHAKIRQDLFGVIDVLALDPERGVVGVQSCGTSFSQHYKKLTEEKADECIEWLETPGTALELWGWRKVKLHRGSKALRWQPRIHTFCLEDFIPGRVKQALLTGK